MGPEAESLDCTGSVAEWHFYGGMALARYAAQVYMATCILCLLVDK